MTVVEQLTNLSGNSTETLKQQQAANLTSMIGKTVTYLDKSGNRVSGTLESVQLGKDGTTATIAGVAGITPSLIVEIQ